MRLVDADKLIEHLKKIYDDCDIEDMLEFARVSNFINNQPTAFDVDKVLKQLQSYKDDIRQWNDTYTSGQISAYEKAIAVVKAGGRDEEK